jgi:ribonuclease J
MKEKVQLAQQKGLFQLGDVWVSPEQMLKKPPDEQCWLLTGSQGEMGSALWRLAHDKSTIKELGIHDTLLVSARVIPGNERTVASLLDLIADRGVTVYNGRDGRHVSGHGHKEDMSALISATKPQFFVPLHGGIQQLKAHRKVVEELGLTDEQIIELRNGQAIQFSNKGDLAYSHASLPSEPWVNNGEINFTPQETVAARGRMSQAGVLIGTLSKGADQITLQGEALGTWNSQPIIERLQCKMTDFLMEHYDLPRQDLKKKLFRIANDEFRLLHKPAPYLFIR